jgi:hypothetical protein
MLSNIVTCVSYVHLKTAALAQPLSNLVTCVLLVH